VHNMLSAGQRLGRYYLMRMIEKGGMGEIYLARDSKLNREVAIKVIGTVINTYTESGIIDEAIRLFQTEAKAISLLDHPHILPLLDYGEEHKRGTLYTFMVMPYRQEGSLAGWILNRESKQLSLQEATHFLQQAADALQYAHDHGTIHRDVKASNFLLFAGKKYHGLPDLQLADFGVAKFMSVISTPGTAIRGTPLYMAPEMWQGEAVPASDQYALAMMIYELLAGRPPFQGRNHQHIMYQHLNIQPQPLSNFNQSVPMEVEIVLMRALLKNPEDRYASVSTFAKAFKRALINGRNIHITLSISPDEARSGSMHVVTLPSGRRVTVGVPRGAYNGQVLQMEGQGEYSTLNGPIGALLVKIEFAKEVERVTLARTEVLEKTVPAPNVPGKEPADPHKNRSKILLLIFLSLGVVVIGVVVIFIFPGILMHDSHSNTTHGKSLTQQTKTIVSHPGATATPDLNATATDQANQTATASATSATATDVSAGATATTIAARGTATAVAAAATVTAYTSIMTSGNRALVDPLQGNNTHYNWDTTTLQSGGGCSFTNGAYHSSMPQQGPFSLCFAETTNYSNFTYQISMQFIQGNVGGIIFRANSTDGTFYYFHISRNGTYGLDIYSGDLPIRTLSQGPFPAILTGPGQTNILGVRANGSRIDLFVNDQFIATVYDSTYASGQIGVVADAINEPTEVAFSYAQVYTQPANS
jgi:eukaryotic-like serine/threonine-protein kinase